MSGKIECARCENPAQEPGNGQATCNPCIQMDCPHDRVTVIMTHRIKEVFHRKDGIYICTVKKIQESYPEGVFVKCLDCGKILDYKEFNSRRNFDE